MNGTADLVMNDLSVREELDALCLLVEVTEGNVITFVLFRSVAERESAVQYLKERLSVPVVEVALSKQRTNPLDLIAGVKGTRACVQVYDLEAALPDATKFLNLRREAYAELPHALVLWVGEHGLREVARHAPDFWTWRSGVFDVRTEQPDVMPVITQQAIQADVRFTDRGDLERRASLYEGLIREYEESDEVGANEVAHLRFKLGNLLYLLRDFDRSERQAKTVKEYAESVEDKALLAGTYHQLGMIAQERRDFDAAESWYQKSLAIKEGQGNDYGAAQTYHQLGRIAEERRDFDAAESWYQKSLAIAEGQGNDYGAAITYGQMGILSALQENYIDAGQWFIKSVSILSRVNDPFGAQRQMRNFQIALHRASEVEQATLRKMWQDAALPPLPEEDEVA